MRKKKMHRRTTWLFCAVVALALMPVGTSAQFHPKDTEWPTYAADLAGTRYRPLDQINASNFSDLEIAWRIKTDNFGDRPEYKLEGTPLMVNGSAPMLTSPYMYNCAPFATKVPLFVLPRAVLFLASRVPAETIVAPE
jgi:hypothetical protein